MGKQAVNKHVHLIHNPKAGDQDYSKKKLIDMVTSCGFTCQYVSIKSKEWEQLKTETALVIIAGGDGTVRRAMKKLLARKMLEKRPMIALLPIGTANNFAKTQKIKSGLPALRKAIESWSPRRIDVGVVNLPKAKFFLEGMGCGILPSLMKEMDVIDIPSSNTAKQELEIALAKLADIAAQHKPQRGTVIIDDKRHEGDFLFIEVLNIKSVGPNLELAPTADPTDGKFHVALLEEGMREAFVKYVKDYRTSGKRSTKVPWKLLEAKENISIH